MRKLNSKVNDELNVMYRRDGELRASVVLKAATPVASPLHNCFTWDDKKAANQFRLVESRNLITACVIVDAKGALEPLLHIPSIKKGEGVYRTATAIVQSESEYERSLREAESSVQTAMTRVAYLVKALRASKQHVDKLPKGQAALRSLELAQHTLQDMQVGDGEA